MTPDTATRFHALDSLRAAMMFLGIYLHAVVAYSPSGGWPYKPTQLTTTLDWSIAVIHIFRMPVFYAMAGFFTALLLQRYGFRRAAENRYRRIVIPFVVGWLLLFPLVMLLAGTGRFGFDRAVDGILSGRFLRFAHPLHLWFLEYLIVLYVLAAVAVVAVRIAIPADVRTLLSRGFRRAVQSWWAPLIFAVPSFFALLLMHRPWLEDPPSFVPVARIVIAYAIPFAFGWMLFLNVDLLETLSRRAWPYAVLAVGASYAYLAVSSIPMNQQVAFYLERVLALFAVPIDQQVTFYLQRAVHSVALWLLIFGVTGLFLRLSSGHSPLRRYLCDSSYFLYIAHMPVIIAFELLLKDVPLPPLAKIPLVLAGTIAVLLPVYRYAVRPTFVGAALNGRRYPVAIGTVLKTPPLQEDRHGAQNPVH
jgi:glucan biosynthesis protein C